MSGFQPGMKGSTYKVFAKFSNTPSKAASRSASRGPTSDEEHDGLLSDINFGNLDEMISVRLNTLLNGDDNNATEATGTVKTKLNSIPEIIKTLQKSRSEVSSNDRELLLNQLYNLVIKKPTLDLEYDDYDYEQDLLSLFKIFQSGKANEFMLADRAITAFIITNIDNAGVLYSEDKSLSILDFLEKKIVDVNLSKATRQCLIYSYTSISMVIYDESSGYGVDNMFEFLLETLLGITTDVVENIPVITSLIYGIGALLTVLVNHANLNELIENLVDSTADLLIDTDSLEVSKPMAMIFGLCYEIYNYDDEFGESLDDFQSGDDVLPYTNTYEITKRLEELIKTSNKKISKKDKKEGRSLFRDVLSTVKFYSDKESRLNKLSSKKSNDEDDYAAQDELVLSHIKLSKSRSLAVKTWFAFFRLIQLKWVYSSGIHTQLANNSRLTNIIRDKPSNEYANKFNKNAGGDQEADEYWTDSKQNKLTHKKKDLAIDHRRMEKLHVSLDQAGVLDNEGTA